METKDLGYFPTNEEGIIIKNIAKGYAASIMTAERYKKAPEEKAELATAKNKYKAAVRSKSPALKESQSVLIQAILSAKTPNWGSLTFKPLS